MKKLLIIFMILFLSGSLFAQEKPTLQSTPDTTVTTAVTYTATDIEVEENSGMVGFQFTFTAGTADSLASAAIWGSLDNSNFVSVASQSISAAGTYFLKEDTPDYIYYKLILTPQSGDSIFVQNVIFIHKEE